MVFTHWIDLVFKIVSLVIFGLILAGLQAVFPKIAAWSSKLPRILKTVGFGVAAIIYYLGFHHPVMDVLATKLYVWDRFGVSATWEQSREMRCLFSGVNVNSKWYPMEEVRLLPIDQRLGVLMAEAKAVSVKRGEASPVNPDNHF